MCKEICWCCFSVAKMWTTGGQGSLSFTISQSLLKLMPTKLVMPSNHLILYPFSSCPQSFPASESFPMSWLFTSGGQSIGGSVSESVLPMEIQHWFSTELTGLISLLSKELSRVFSRTSLKVSFHWCSAFLMVQLSHPYVTTGKTIALNRWTFVGKVMCLLLNMFSRFVIAFIPKSKHLLIFWLSSSYAVISEPKKIKSVTAIILHLFAIKLWDQIPWSLFFEHWVLSQFPTLLFHLHQEALEFLFTFYH